MYIESQSDPTTSAKVAAPRHISLCPHVSLHKSHSLFSRFAVMTSRFAAALFIYICIAGRLALPYRSITRTTPYSCCCCSLCLNREAAHVRDTHLSVSRRIYVLEDISFSRLVVIAWKSARSNGRDAFMCVFRNESPLYIAYFV